MDETDDFIDEQDTDCQLERHVEKPQQWNGFGDNVAQRFLRLRGITSEAQHEAALERHAGRAPAPRIVAAFAVGPRPALAPPRPGPRLHLLPSGSMHAVRAVR